MFWVGRIRRVLQMLAQGFAKGDVCQIHSTVRLHSPNTADFYNEPTKKTLEDTFGALRSREGQARDL